MTSGSGATIVVPSNTSENLKSEAELAQAFKDLAKGEKTASAMEQQLTNLEQKIDDLLASAEEQTDDLAANMLSGNQTVVGEEVQS